MNDGINKHYLQEQEKIPYVGYLKLNAISLHNVAFQRFWVGLIYIYLFFPDRIGRSMPNLNKIRGQKKSAGPPASSKSGLGRGQNYGLSSRHHNSDPRIGKKNM